MAKAVVVFHPGGIKTITRFNGESDKQALRKARKFAQRVEEEIPDHEGIFLIDTLNPTSPPSGAKRPSGKFWCPYCADWRTFKPWYDYLRCEVCNISNEDWYVKKYNRLWSASRGIALRDQALDPKELEKRAKKRERARQRRLRRKEGRG